MSSYIENSIKYGACQQRIDHSEQVENKIKEVVVVELSAIEIVDKRDTGVILWSLIN